MNVPSARRLTLTLTLLLATGLAHAADETSVKKGLEGFLGAPAVESVKKIPYGGLYEIVLKSGELLYTDGAVSFILDGSLIDGKTRQNITQARLAQLQKIDFASLPLDHAIKQVRGNGKRVLATFEDPNCGYCKRLAKDLTGLKDTTIYTFLYPILGQDSVEKSKNIWCAKDRAGAWTEWMTAGKLPAAASCDSAILDQNVALGQKMKISGTPTIFVADGNRLPGAVPLAQIEKAITDAGTR